MMYTLLEFAKAFFLQISGNRKKSKLMHWAHAMTDVTHDMNSQPHWKHPGITKVSLSQWSINVRILQVATCLSYDHQSTNLRTWLGLSGLQHATAASCRLHQLSKISLYWCLPSWSMRSVTKSVRFSTLPTLILEILNSSQLLASQILV